MSDLSDKERKDLEGRLKAREELLLPIYHQVAVQFADLHDTPGRMLEKGVISVSHGRPRTGLSSSGGRSGLKPCMLASPGQLQDIRSPCPDQLNQDFRSGSPTSVFFLPNPQEISIGSEVWDHQSVRGCNC